MIEIPDEFRPFNDLSNAIGQTIVLWAATERQFDNWMVTIADLNHPVSGFDLAKLPNAYEQKAKFLRKSFSQVDVLQPFKEYGIGLLDQADDVVDVRHAFAHGTLDSLIPTDGRFTFRCFKRVRGMPVVDLKHFDLADWPPIYESLRGLLHHTPRMTKMLGDAFPMEPKRGLQLPSRIRLKSLDSPR